MKQRLAFLQRPGAWFWCALLLGAGLRAYFAVFTEGTFDVAIKQHHGNQLRQLGLLEYYRQSELFNHPPLAGGFFAAAATLARELGLPFRLLLRAPFALLDLGTVLLLLRLFRGSEWRFAVAAGFWLNPLAILMSSYHGNTDTAVGFFALLAVLLASERRELLAGVALGAGLWIKLPVLVAAPAVFFALPGVAARARFGAAAALTALLGVVPFVFVEPVLLFERVVGYPGWGVVTPSGVAIWGIGHVLRLPQGGVALLEASNTVLCWLPIFALAWLRRTERSPRELGATVCGCFLALYGFTSLWAWQYLAWSVPFWFCLGWGFSGAATLVLGSYVYGAYAVFTSSPWLRGRWDFVHHAQWPTLLYVLRDAAVVLCLVSACVLLARASAAELRRRRERSA